MLDITSLVVEVVVIFSVEVVSLCVTVVSTLLTNVVISSVLVELLTMFSGEGATTVSPLDDVLVPSVHVTIVTGVVFVVVVLTTVDVSVVVLVNVEYVFVFLTNVTNVLVCFGVTVVTVVVLVTVVVDVPSPLSTVAVVST